MQAENREDGNERVAKGVAKEYGGFGKSLGASGADIIGGELFDDGTTNHARENGGESGSECDRREEEVRQAASARNRQQAKNYGENENQNWAESEVGNRKTEEGEESDGAVAGRAPFFSGE